VHYSFLGSNIRSYVTYTPIYGDVMVHVFQEPVRDFYDLDGLWSEAAEVSIPDQYHWERRVEAH
jgi:hypothetical protein